MESLVIVKFKLHCIYGSICKTR